MANFRDLFGDPADPRRVESALDKMFAAIEEAGGAVGSHSISMPQVVAPEQGAPTHNHPFEIITRGNKQKVLVGHVAWNDGLSTTDDYRVGDHGIIQQDVECTETNFETVTGEKAWWLKMNYTVTRQSRFTNITISGLTEHLTHDVTEDLAHVAHAASVEEGAHGETTIAAHDATVLEMILHVLEMSRVNAVTFGSITLQDRDEYNPPTSDSNAQFANGAWYKKLADVDVAGDNAFVDTRYVQENLVFPELVDAHFKTEPVPP